MAMLPMQAFHLQEQALETTLGSDYRRPPDAQAMQSDSARGMQFSIFLYINTCIWFNLRTQLWDIT